MKGDNEMLLYYVRCSTEEQSELRQLESAKNAGAEKIFVDKRSGSSTEGRTALKEMIEFSRAGDVVMCSDISRCARNTKDLLTIVEQLSDKGVTFVSEKEGIDTSTEIGKFLLSVFGAMYQLELSNIRTRQMEGIQATKKYHPERYAGRKKIDMNKEEFIGCVKLYKEGKMKAKEIQTRFNISANTMYRRINEYNL